MADNSRVRPDNIVPENEQLFNDVWLRTKFQNNSRFTPRQIETLEYLAFQCPLQGGQAVYKARSLYAAVKDTVYDDERICADTPERAFKTEEEHNNTVLTNNKLQLTVFPNPAEREVFVSIDGKVESDIQIEWFDALGRKAQSDNLPVSSNPKSIYTISTAGLANGVYQFTATSKGEKLYSNKVVVAK